MTKLRQKQGMTLLETLVCLCIIALCFVVMLRAFSDTNQVKARQGEDEAMTQAVSALIVELEAAPPEEKEGTLEGAWRYKTSMEDDAYVLTVENTKWRESHHFILCQAEDG